MNKLVYDDRLDHVGMVVGVKVILLNIACAVYSYAAESLPSRKAYWEQLGEQRLAELKDAIFRLKVDLDMSVEAVDKLENILTKYEELVRKYYKCSRKNLAKVGPVISQMRQLHRDLLFQLGEVTELGELGRKIV